MDILRYRPLFVWCALFMAFLTVGSCLPAAGKWILGGAFGVGALLFSLWRIRRRDGYRAEVALVAAVLAGLALWRSGDTLRQGLAVETIPSPYTAVTVTGTVTDRRGSGGYMTAYALSLETVDGEQADGMALVTCHYPSELIPGNRIVLDAKRIPLSEAAGDGYDAMVLLGDGYVMGLLSEEEGDVTVTEEESRHLLAQAGKLRRRLSARLEVLVGKGSGGLPSALLLGDKSYLSDSLRRDFTRAGGAHLLAISGLHMTLLFGMLAGLFILLRVPKRLRSILLGGCLLAYLILLGFPPSATRAAIMLGMTYLSGLLSARSDPVTSLGLAGAMILAATPYAVADGGFWMSFMATLGILTVMPVAQKRMEEWDSKAPSRWRGLRSALGKGLLGILVGVIAMSFTLFAVAVVIGEIGILSPLSTLLLTPLCAGVLGMSLLCLPLMNTSLGVWLGDGIRGLCRSLAALTEWMSKPSWVVVSLRQPGVTSLILAITAVMTGATLLLLVVRLPRRRRLLVLLPMAVGWISVGGVLAVHRQMTSREVAVAYLQPSSASEALVLVSGEGSVVCDLSNGSLSALSSAVTAAHQQGATELSALVLTHYHTRLSGALDTVLRRETVRALWCPAPTDAEEYHLLASFVEKAARVGVPLYLYGAGESVPLPSGGELTVKRADLARSDHPVLLASLSYGSGDRLVYCGAGVFESDLSEGASELMRDTDAVIFGSHGPVLKKPYGETLRLPSSCQVILSAHGDVAAHLDPACLPEDTALWLGQRRLILSTESP